MPHPEAVPARDGRIDILGIGSIAVDDFVCVPRYPDADAKVEVTRSYRYCGGLTATALVAASRLGSRCAYAGALGDDELSMYCIQRLEAEEVEVAWSLRRPGAGPIHSTIVVGEDRATRNVFFDPAAFVSLPPDWPAAGLPDGLRVLFVDNFSIAAQSRLARLAREGGIPIVADFEENRAEGFDALLALCDHLILSSDFALRLTGCSEPRDAVAALWRDGRALVAVTCGGAGAVYTERAVYPRVLHQRAFPVEVVDTTGCGDVFHGAYAAGLVRGLDIPGSLRFAAAAAALKATRPGGQLGAPTLDEVSQFLEREA